MTGRPFVMLACTMGVLFFGCSESPTEPDRSTAIRTDADVYTLSGSAANRLSVVSFIYRNPTDAPIYFPNCNGRIQTVLERERSGAWLTAYDPGGDDCLSPPVVAEVGGTASGEVVVAVRPQESGISSNWSEGMEPPGIYRIRVTSAVYDYSDESAPFGTPVQTEYLLSNTFEIRP